MAIRKQLFGCLLTASALLWPSLGIAQARVFVCAPGAPELEGDVTLPNLEDCSEAVNAGESAAIPLDVQPGGGGGIGAAQFRPLRIIKNLDRASAGWRQYLVTGRLVDSLEIHYVDEDSQSGALEVVLTIELSDSAVMGLTASIGDGGRPVEMISVLPQRIQWRFLQSGDIVDFDLTEPSP